MCRAVFADADRVVCKDEDRAQFHQRSHSQSIAAVVCERKECSAVGDESAVQSDTVHDGTHTELANTVVDVASEIGIRSHGLNTFPVSQVGACQVCRAAEQLRQMRCVSIQGHLTGFTGCDCLSFAGCVNDSLKDDVIPVFGKLALHAAF